jgi:hypothetical protein
VSLRAVPYPPSGAIVRIPDAIWSHALAVVRDYAGRGRERGKHGSEALVYLGGTSVGSEILVSGLYVLNHPPQGDRVVVTPAEARWLLRTMRARDEKLVAQVHSHRGRAGHSFGDDLNATSFHDGFLSIVVPRFGVAVNGLSQCVVLEFRDGGFVELGPAEQERRIKVYAQVVERRGDAAAAGHVEEGCEWWARFARRLRSIARKPR